MGVVSKTQELGFDAMDGLDFSDSELSIHVRHILNSVAKGNADDYHQLVAVLHNRKYYSPDDVAMLVTTLKALSGAVMCIDDFVHQSLITSIFSMSLWDYGPDVMDAIIELIISLAASSGNYIDSCLTMLVANFVPPLYFIPMLSQPRGISRKGQVLARLHSALKDITELVPLAPVRLLSIVIQRKPAHRAQEKVLMMYAENMLKLEGGALGDMVRVSIISGVLDSLFELDAEIGWDETSQEDSTKGIFSMELEDIEGTTDDELGNVDDELPTEITRKHLRGNTAAEKLDNLMILVFEYLESCKDSGRLVQVFECLLQSFQSTILTAYKLKFAQFVVFFACTLDPQNCGTRFATMLVDIFVSDSNDPLKRMSAAAYLASFLSRAQFLYISQITNALKRLVEWCLSYCTTHNVKKDPKAHRIFYSGCQAIMYVLCFRMRSILADPWFKSQLLVLPLDKILTHKLSPLKVCLPIIVKEFLLQAKAAQLFSSSDKFLFDDHLDSELSKDFGGRERLDMFFPFDPYLLKNSERYIRPNYIFWSMVRQTYDDESSDEEAIEVLMNRNDTDLEDHELDDFDSALNKMSITPRNSLKHFTQMPSRIRPSMSPESL